MPAKDKPLVPTSQDKDVEGKQFGDTDTAESAEELKQRLEVVRKEEEKRTKEIQKTIETQMFRQETAMKNTLEEIMNGGPVQKKGETK